jgi:hypothetical protein
MAEPIVEELAKANEGKINFFKEGYKILQPSIFFLIFICVK